MEVSQLGAWAALLAPQLHAAYFRELTQRLDAVRRTEEVYPPAGREFFALTCTPPERVRAVILGQDPYHEPGQAMGLAFSVAAGTPLPPSLRNIFRELADDVGVQPPESGDLTAWARQGVLLLNSTLTVKAHCAGSHQGHGWETFTDAVINRLANMRNHLVFILWGSYAIRKGAFIDRSRHLFITSPHPSPLSAYRGFFGSRPFSTANAYLESNGIKPINW